MEISNINENNDKSTDIDNIDYSITNKILNYHIFVLNDVIATKLKIVKKLNFLELVNYYKYKKSKWIQYNSTLKIMQFKLKTILTIKHHLLLKTKRSKFLKWSNYINITNKTLKLIETVESKTKDNINKEYEMLNNKHKEKTVLLDDINNKIKNIKLSYENQEQELKIKEDKLSKLKADIEVKNVIVIN